MSDGEAQAVLDFWFGAPGSPEHLTVRTLWFQKRAATDREIAARFGYLVELALGGEFARWAEHAEGALARILLLDQFTRNVYRDTPRAFAGDALALRAATAMVQSKQDQGLAPVQRSFVYMPYEHAEDLAAQDESLRLFTRLAADSPEQAESLTYASRHREVILRFGRFPHRNAILGRQSSVEEMVFLREPGSRF